MNRKFSINSIALGNIRRRRGRYLLLIFGIVLAIYFVAAALLFADTMFTSLVTSAPGTEVTKARPGGISDES